MQEHPLFEMPGGSPESYMKELGEAARRAAPLMARADAARKNRALMQLAEMLPEHMDDIRAANEADLALARQSGYPEAFIDRLTVTPAVLTRMAEGLRQIAALPDPVGEISGLRPQPSGIIVGRMRVPLGVIGIIYESRPNVTVDAAALALKSGNCAILRGGREAIRTNTLLWRLTSEALSEAGLPREAV